MIPHQPWRQNGQAVSAWGAALLLLIIYVTRVAAHTITVVHSDPAADAVVAGQLTQVMAQFDEELATKRSTMQVLAANGQPVSEGNGAVDLNDPDHQTLIAHLPTPLPNGAYTVQWHVVLTDGDVSDGQFRFTVATTAAATKLTVAPLSSPRPVTTVSVADGTTKPGAIAPVAAPAGDSNEPPPVAGSPARFLSAGMLAGLLLLLRYWFRRRQRV